MRPKKQLDDREIELAWALNNELRIALEEREILLDARNELLEERKSIRDRISVLEMLSKHMREHP